MVSTSILSSSYTLSVISSPTCETQASYKKGTGLVWVAVLRGCWPLGDGFVTIEKWVRLGFDLVRGGARDRGQLLS